MVVFLRKYRLHIENDDSFYQDAKINSMLRSERKTFIKNWGTHELSLNVFK